MIFLEAHSIFNLFKYKDIMNLNEFRFQSSKSVQAIGICSFLSVIILFITKVSKVTKYYFCKDICFMVSVSVLIVDDALGIQAN